MGIILNHPLAAATIAFALMATAILVWFLLRRPPLVASTKIILLVGIGVLPIAAAGTGNYSGYEATKKREFCGSCHVMGPWAEDSDDVTSSTLASRHARNPSFGDENCYRCHEDYGMFGTVTTKLGGMRHVYEYLRAYHSMTLDEAVPTIHIRKPFPNSNCMQCHSTEGDLWLSQPDHARLLKEIRSGEASCASEGCHGPAHPFSKHWGEKP